MAISAEQAAIILPKLANYLAAQRWINMRASDLDAEYQKLTDAEKLVIVNSLINNDDKAKELIKQKLDPPVQEWAKAQAKIYIDANTIPIDVIANIF
ncbi:MAG: hypothetical protein M0R47_16675 [Methylobacter sp.]|uniref:hypothetical protein n=1 Tax=Methylobacter sp. TaxID=2051955 RepID=UPI0025E9E9FD|nr:hypothetical protein [Methylobacter sp.]MCK9622157.1 hypothetical protein [Methylobacter sp.]